MRYQLAYQGVEYEMVEYEQADDFNCDAWLSKKFTLGLDFPNLPYFIDGDFKMSETIPIQKYIADKWNPELLGKDAQTRATVNMVSNVLMDLKGSVTNGCYGDGDLSKLQANVANGVPKVITFLGDKKFLAGDEVTWVDFYFVEVVELMSKLVPELFTTYPSLSTYKDSVFALPKLAEYLASEGCIDRTYTFNNKSAKIQFQS